ncbi:MAG: peptidoglycan-binding protein [Bacilli bacterium]|nr:peptidoglycan-binding protein [Bacilli bacterium]
MINLCKDISTNFSNIQMGEAVWLDGHIGIYWENGQVIECSPAFKNKVQITQLSQRKWLKHGKLPFITYEKNDSFLPARGYFKKGDSGEKIAKIDDFFANKVKGNYFGDYTTAIVKEFQRQNKLEQDGNIGPITLAKMKEQGFKE